VHSAQRIPRKTKNEREPHMARLISKPKTTSRAVKAKSKAKPAKKNAKK